MTKVRRAVGARGERLAGQHLTARGLAVLARNWRCADGKVDLILRDGPDVVFGEVKNRRETRYGTPGEAIRPDKVRRLPALAAHSLSESAVRPREIWFDVVAGAQAAGGPLVVGHTRVAF